MTEKLQGGKQELIFPEELGVSQQFFQKMNGEWWSDMLYLSFGKLMKAYFLIQSEKTSNPSPYNYLDRGHAAFLDKINELKENELLKLEESNLNEAKDRLEHFFTEWKGWFQENHPHYLWTKEERKKNYWAKNPAL